MAQGTASTCLEPTFDRLHNQGEVEGHLPDRGEGVSGGGPGVGGAGHTWSMTPLWVT